MKFERLPEKLRDAKIPMLLLCVGLLLALSGGHGKTNHSSADESTSERSAEMLSESEKRLSSLLQMIDGVGEVHVLLSYETSSETVFASDNGETVLLSAGSGTETALAKYTRYPRYQGAVIVCGGADSSAVKLSVMEATARFTGLRSDQITVLQLKT